MKKKLSCKDLFSLSWKDFIFHFINWLFLFGVQLAVVVGFLSCCAISLFMFSYFIPDYSKLLTVAIVSIASVFTFSVYVIYPIMYKQNALDAAFKRPMSGYDINNRFFTYTIAMYVYWTLVAFTSCFFLLGFFLAQRWRFVGLHILEHGGNIRQAFKASWEMTRGYVWFFIGISLIQSLLLIFCACTIVGLMAAVALGELVDAHMYKKLHMEMDKDILLCKSCEQ